jgi:hypothetical protein
MDLIDLLFWSSGLRCKLLVDPWFIPCACNGIVRDTACRYSLFVTQQPHRNNNNNNNSNYHENIISRTNETYLGQCVLTYYTRATTKTIKLVPVWPLLLIFFCSREPVSGRRVLDVSAQERRSNPPYAGTNLQSDLSGISLLPEVWSRLRARGGVARYSSHV